MEATQCVGCDTERARVRAVLDVDSWRTVGVVCRACLTAEYGATILDPVWTKPDGCAICERDAFYAIADAGLVREATDPGQVLARRSAESGEEPVRLCDEHLTWVAGEEEPTDPLVADGRGYRW